MRELFEKEISELHSFFENWYQGEISNTERVFKRLKDVLAPEFTLITPDGHVVEREQLLALMRTEYATKPGIKIWVENCELRFSDEKIFLVIYEEHGILREQERVSLITAFLRKNHNLENGLEWFHIHEVHVSSQNNSK